ncbi:MAG: sensor histidine kinase, partial [Salibacteraceae bacterium]
REQASRAMEQAQKALLKDLQTVFHNQVSMTGFYLQTLIEQLKKKHPGELSQQIDQYVQRLIYRAKHATDEKLQDLYKHGLEAGFFTLIDRFEDDHNFIVEMDLEGIDVRYDLQTEMKLIQAAEEFLTNALKYSKHSTAKLIFRAGDQFVLQVIDPGEGFKVDQRSSTGIGIGLDLINSIALTMNGTVNYSKTTDGFVAKLILPKREA